MGAQSRHLGVSALSNFVLLRAPPSAASTVSRPGAGQPLIYVSCYNSQMLSLTDIVIRLFVAAVIGCLIGLNRFAHHRFIGVRTLGLVALGAAGLVVAALDAGSGSEQLAAASRIIQGIVTGIGFVGAGVIVQGARGHKVHGLTTAATVWVSAVAGILCGLGAWRVTVIVSLLVAVVLVVGGPIEKLLVRRYGADAEDDNPASPKAAISDTGSFT